MKWDRKGQFYLIAAIIIIAIIVGLVAKLNVARVNQPPLPFVELSENFEREAIKIIDKGILAGKSFDEIEADLETFASNFTEYTAIKSPKVGFLYVFGNATNITVVNFLLKDAKVDFSDKSIITTGGGALTLHRIKLEVGGESFVRDFEIKAKEFKGINFARGKGEFVKLNIGGIPYTIAFQGIVFKLITITCETIDGFEECFVELTQEI